MSVSPSGAARAAGGDAGAAPLLRVQALETAYGASQVLFGIDLEVRPGEVVGLLGRNGMGKTTLVRSILGLVPSRAGSVAFDGHEVRGLAPDRIARMGIAVVPEGRQVFPNLSVDEHLTAFAALRGGSVGVEPWNAARVYRLFPRLAERYDNLGNQLSGGEQQMLAIGRALVTNPRLLILDEATEGLAPLIREEIWRCLAELRAAGQTILVIDKYVNRLIRLADRHVIVERGRVAWRGTSAELDADRTAWKRYLGV
jgi:branched-chain amino acid transport system ATP-binding protein